MEYLRQFTIILAASFAGELLSMLLPMPIPAGIYGLLILFLALCIGLVPLRRVKKAADYLITIMPVMFIGPCVALIEQGEVLRRLALPLVLICCLATCIVMYITGRVAQRLVHKDEKEEQK